MGDVVLHHIAHKKHGNENAHDRINQIEKVEGCGIKTAGEDSHYLVDKPVEQKSRHGRQQAYQKCQHENEHAFAHMGGSPCVYAGNKSNNGL